MAMPMHMPVPMRGDAVTCRMAATLGIEIDLVMSSAQMRLSGSIE